MNIYGFYGFKALATGPICVQYQGINLVYLFRQIAQIKRETGIFRFGTFELFSQDYTQHYLYAHS